MCGIFGFGFQQRRPPEEWLRSVALKMQTTLQHRGPDDGGVWTDTHAGLALGHRRLSILDLSAAGRQPMLSACGRWVITYNGEVYNFQELRSELESLGHMFRGHSDTEVILAAIAQWGIENAVRRLNGMFAFGVWDQETHTLTLARDRVGKKPLYYGWCGDVFLFGSELKALRAHPDFASEIDRGALGLFLQYSCVPAPYSIYKHLKKLPAASLLSIDLRCPAESPAPRVYWSAREVAQHGERQPYQGSFEEATQTLDTLLRDAVSQRMIADVGLGALLSGGIDSTTIVALMQSMSAKPVQTFSIGFREPKFNEAQHALAIARHLGTDHTELYVTAQDTMAVLPQLPSVYDEPFADPSQIPTFLLSQLARREVSVALSGDGGDELFIGYKRYTSWLKQWDTRCVRNPLWLRRGQAKALKAISQAGWRVFEPHGSVSPPPIPKWLRLGTVLEKRARGITALSPVEFYACKHAQYEPIQDLIQQSEDSSSQLTSANAWPEVTELVRGLLYMDFACYLADDVLVKVDRASMAVSLEVRCPLLDYRVVELAWSLPLGMRLDQSGGKRILRQVLKRYVPSTLTERPKMGFGVPVGDWVRGPLRDWAENLLDEKRLREEGFLQADAVRRIWHQHLSGWHNHKNLVWNLLMFQAWYEVNS